MNGRRALSVLSLMFLLTPAVAAVAPAPQGAAPRAATASPPVARVGDLTVSRAELDARMKAAMAEFARRNANVQMPAALRDVLTRQVLESMIRMQLLTLEARRTGALATASEADAELRREPYFNPGGVFDERRFQYMKTTQAAAYAQGIETLRARIGAIRLAQDLDTRLAPSEADARAEAMQQLAHASVDQLALRVNDFDGKAPEPRERDVLDYYAAHRSEWQRTARATLTVAFVNEPALADAQRNDPAALRAWTARMRTVADSLLGEIRSGKTFDRAVEGLGPRSGVVVTPDNFPGYWRGTAAQASQVFASDVLPRVLMEPVEATEGWMLVRIEDMTPAHVAPLREVAAEIRTALRQDSRQHHEEHEARALYAQVRDSLAAPGWPVRYGFADTASFAVPVPADAEVDAYYRSHAADYSAFDPATGAIVVTPLAQVRDDVRRSLLTERRVAAAQEAVQALARTWRAGRRDAALEARLQVREVPPAVRGSALDRGVPAQAVADSLWAREVPQGAGFGRYGRGWIVWQAGAPVAKVTPGFEQVAAPLVLRLREQRAREDEVGARALFDADPSRFVRGKTLNFTRITITPPALIRVPLSRAEVEKYHHDHIDRYSAPEVVSARHILIAPADATPAADSAAKHRAEELLRRIRAGEDFSDLARRFSDDPATRDKGGDLGSFGRGAMVPVFERAVFTLKANELLSQPLRTELGWHVVECLAHEAALVHPLKFVYTAVSADAAIDKARTIARDRTDSLLARARNWSQLRAACERMGYPVHTYSYSLGDRSAGAEVLAYFERVAASKPGEIVRPPFYSKSDGFWLSTLDSLSDPSAPSWEQAKDLAVAEYRRGAGRRALLAKKAEMDSLAAGGWSVDSLAALWGGYVHVRDVAPGRGLPGLGGGSVVDSLVFGRRGGPAPLPEGQVTGWLELPGGYARIRLVERRFGTPEQLAARTQAIRNGELERRMQRRFDELKKRYPVTILDPRLRDIQLPEPPQGFDD